MRRSSVSITLMTPLVACLFVALGCDGEPEQTRPTFVGPQTLISVEHFNGGSACEEERPEDVGCTTICKPCLTWLCLDGEWVSEDISPPDFICDPPDLPDAPPISACPSIAGQCPAECSFCYPS